MSLLDGLKFLFNPAFLIEKAFTLCFGGGGGGSGNTTSTSYSTNLPEYAKPYYEELLKQTGKAVFTTDSAGNVTGVKSRPTYTGERVAGFTPEQLAIQQQVFGMQTPSGMTAGQGTLGNAATLAGGAGQAGLARALGYQPGRYTIGAVEAPVAEGGTMEAARSDYDPRLTTFQMQGPAGVGAERASAEMFSPEAAAYYMSPYQQAVTDIQMREARQQANIEKQNAAMGAIGRGTFGGARQALIQAERDRGTAQLLSDIQAKGGQAAFENAQKQFEADQQRRMAAQQINVQSGLQAALANQQMRYNTEQQNLNAALSVQNLGTETGRAVALANLNNQQQANVQNLAAKLQTQGLNAEQAMRASLANQQTQLQLTQLMEQANQFAAATGKDIGIAGMNQSLEAGKAQVAAAAQEQASRLERLKAQAATAEEKQQLDQQLKDLNYQTFMEQQNFQRSMLEYYSSILRGNANALGTTQVNYAQAPSALSQIGGLGLAGLSLAQVLGRG